MYRLDNTKNFALCKILLLYALCCYWTLYWCILLLYLQIQYICDQLFINNMVKSGLDQGFSSIVGWEILEAEVTRLKVNKIGNPWSRMIQMFYWSILDQMTTHEIS